MATQWRDAMSGHEVVTASPTRQLTTMAIGDQCVIAGLSGGDVDPTNRRLSDLGFLPGTPVTVLRKAPFGDPIVYLLAGYQMSLRSAQAQRILVTSDAGSVS